MSQARSIMARCHHDHVLVSKGFVALALAAAAARSPLHRSGTRPHAAMLHVAAVPPPSPPVDYPLSSSPSLRRLSFSVGPTVSARPWHDDGTFFLDDTVAIDVDRDGNVYCSRP